MAKSRAQGSSSDPSDRVVCRNRRARHDYDLFDEIDCGIALRGSEVKSVRNGKIVLEDAFARIQDGELWLCHCDIAEYPQATVMNHEPRRDRKLLVHKRELAKLAAAVDQKGFTLVPLEVKFSRGLVKVRIAVGKGRKEYDHRDRIKRDTDRKEIRAAMLKHQ